jgi:RNA polymerase primary sigma factor
MLSAPRILDEGIDVPAADLGIIVGASNSRRQMIQRTGRVLRTKDDRAGRHAS